MANKRPLSLAMGNPTTTMSSTGGVSKQKQRCFEIKPVIMKRSEICNNCAPVVMFHKNTINTNTNPTALSGADSDDMQSCLRGPSQALRRKPFTASSRQQTTNEAACSVQFRSNVTVRRIPSRHEYSEDMRQDLWSNLDEIRENALRNEAEFSFDGCDWRECSEEEAMYVDRRSGFLIHPFHVDTIRVFNGQDWNIISNNNDSNNAKHCLRQEA